MNSKRRTCPNCGAPFAHSADAKCARCGYLAEPPASVWWRYFWLSVVATPGLCIATPLWGHLLQDFFPSLPWVSWFRALPLDAALLGGVLTLMLGASISAHLLVRAQGLGSHSANTVAYWMLFVFLYAMIISFGLHAIRDWMR